MGIREAEKTEMQGLIVIEVGEKKLTDVTTSMKMWKKIHRKDRHTGEQEREHLKTTTIE